MKKQKVDVFLLITIISLLVVGFLALATASIPLSLKLTGNATHYLFHQILFGLLPGLILGFIAFKVSLNKVKKLSFIVFVFSIILMLLVFVPGLSKTEFGATRWLNLGFTSVQPSEFLKLSAIFYLATILDDEKNRKKFFAFITVLALICSILIFQKDTGTLFVIFATALAMFFCSKTPIKQTLLTVCGAAAGFITLIILSPYRMQRMFSFLNPNTDVLGSGYHINQSLITIGSGGLLGSGLGLGMQKFGFVPQSISDSIFTILAEEIGFIGVSLLIILFLVFFFRVMVVAKRSSNQYLKLMAIGIGCWIIVQTFVNIGAMTGVFPLTGIPLPFISYGGTHLIAELIACGLLLNISRK
ncbi:MAG: putative peptidoglycan glycosyltransferase FtsW [Candidatus Pacebacteria bacterium]|nr:putative peptidoglycan glycosyltransferase FtsW [Candidatus Paceibacterota bacterium]MDD2757072.1 putative peptidoglycan glycosyltransferase FtsW [Candidatus Paceibacterota bacterium]MDD3283692.1 putative peptidoglycan glycosyltransferase FtsW [Candidatus Paceibacterota bacterium]MDD3969833.1 putative peptidoglycan glycosyltransferase FtsW [Candidatus Paceibacterota bacterium]MDD4737755.1 putative peptidoglycan glycosyltransferase FtsW [Candidatus Paceibacterota bacterium]